MLSFGSTLCAAQRSARPKTSFPFYEKLYTYVSPRVSGQPAEYWFVGFTRLFEIHICILNAYNAYFTQIVLTSYKSISLLTVFLLYSKTIQPSALLVKTLCFNLGYSITRSHLLWPLVLETEGGARLHATFFTARLSSLFPSPKSSQLKYSLDCQNLPCCFQLDA